MSRRIEKGTPDPKVGGSNPLRHAIHFPLGINDLGKALRPDHGCPRLSYFNLFSFIFGKKYGKI
jgi:hypothetical protein